MVVFDEKRESKPLAKIINEMVDRINDNTQRLRILEQEREILDSRIGSLEKNMLSLTKQVQKSIADNEGEIKKLETKVSQMENTIKEIIKYMRNLATKAKISELEELVEIYNPLKSNFVTREEVEKIIEEKITNK